MSRPLKPFYFPFVIFVIFYEYTKDLVFVFSTAIDTADLNGHYIGVQQLETSKFLTPNAIVVIPWLEINGTSKGKPSYQYRLVCCVFSTWQKTELK